MGHIEPDMVLPPFALHLQAALFPRERAGGGPGSGDPVEERNWVGKQPSVSLQGAGPETRGSGGDG